MKTYPKRQPEHTQEQIDAACDAYEDYWRKRLAGEPVQDIEPSPFPPFTKKYGGEVYDGICEPSNTSFCEKRLIPHLGKSLLPPLIWVLATEVLHLLLLNLHRLGHICGKLVYLLKRRVFFIAHNGGLGKGE